MTQHKPSQLLVFKTITGLFFTTALVSGCAPPPQLPPKKPDPILVRLESSADRIAKDLSHLRALEQSRTQQRAAVAKAVATSSTPTSGPLLKPVSLAWYGPVYPAVEAVARIIGYRVEEVGKLPEQPKMVRINASQRQAYLVLADIGWQMGDAAGVHVRDAEKLIQVVYVGK